MACAHLAKSGLSLYLGPGRLQGEQVDRTARRTWVDTHIPKMDIGLWSGYWLSCCTGSLNSILTLNTAGELDLESPKVKAMMLLGTIIVLGNLFLMTSYPKASSKPPFFITELLTDTTPLGLSQSFPEAQLNTQFYQSRLGPVLLKQAQYAILALGKAKVFWASAVPAAGIGTRL